MNRVGVDGFGEIGTDGTGGRFLRDWSRPSTPVLGDRALAFEHLDHHRTGGHEGHQVLVERTAL